MLSVYPVVDFLVSEILGFGKSTHRLGRMAFVANIGVGMEKTNILLNDFVAQWRDVGPSVQAAVERVGQSGWLILGDEVVQFERELSAFWGLPHSIGVANGLDAIEICLRALGLRQGERVLTTPLSAFATSLAIVRAGGVPVFVDTDESGLLDLNQAREFLSVNRDVRFMVPVHLYGHSMDLQQLKRLKDDFNLIIVEDCAQSIGAQSHGMPVGAVGQMAATSFYPTKNLGCLGDGGAILTASKELDDTARSLRDYGQSKKYVHDQLGLNSRLDELQAAILRTALLPKLAGATERRRVLAEQLTSGIKNPRLKVITPSASSVSVWHLFPVIVDGDRAALQAHLKACGVSSGIHYPIIIPRQAALDGMEGAAGEYPKAQSIADRELSLPIHPYLRDDEVERIVSACNSW